MGVEEAVSRAVEPLSLLQTMVLERSSSKEFAEDVMRMAVEQEVTFHDSSYLSMARTRNAVLVTEDAELLEKAGRVSVKAERVSERFPHVKPP